MQLISNTRRTCPGMALRHVHQGGACESRMVSSVKACTLEKCRNARGAGATVIATQL